MSPRRVERFEFRLTPNERETLRQASEALGGIDTAEFVRRFTLLAASNVIQLLAGEINTPLAMAQYSGALMNYVTLPMLAELNKQGKYPNSPRGYTVETIIRDENGKDVSALVRSIESGE